MEKNNHDSYAAQIKGKTGLRRSHLRLKLARMVNKTSPVKVKTTKRETGAAKAAR